MLFTFYGSLLIFVAATLLVTGFVGRKIPDGELGGIVKYKQLFSWGVAPVLVLASSALGLFYAGEPVVPLVVHGLFLALVANGVAGITLVQKFLSRIGASKRE